MTRLRGGRAARIGRVDFRDARAGAPQRERCAARHQRLAERSRSALRIALGPLTGLRAQRAQRHCPREIASRRVVRRGLRLGGRIDADIERPQIIPPACSTLRPVIVEARRRGGLLDEVRRELGLAALPRAPGEQERRNAVVVVAARPVREPIDRVARRKRRPAPAAGRRRRATRDRAARPAPRCAPAVKWRTCDSTSAVSTSPASQSVRGSFAVNRRRRRSASSRSRSACQRDGGTSPARFGTRWRLR